MRVNSHHILTAVKRISSKFNYEKVNDLSKIEFEKLLSYAIVECFEEIDLEQFVKPIVEKWK